MVTESVSVWFICRASNSNGGYEICQNRGLVWRADFSEFFSLINLLYFVIRNLSHAFPLLLILFSSSLSCPQGLYLASYSLLFQTYQLWSTWSFILADQHEKNYDTKPRENAAKV